MKGAPGEGEEEKNMTLPPLGGKVAKPEGGADTRKITPTRPSGTLPPKGGGVWNIEIGQEDAMNNFFRVFNVCVFLFFSACAGESALIPELPTSISEAEVTLPNPISIVVDETNGQIVVANSNIDVLFDAGSLALFSFDAADTNAPVLSLTEILETPNYATQMYYDGAGSIYLPFRETATTDDSADHFNKYTLTAGDISETLAATVEPDPYGITSFGGELYVVSDDVLGIYNTSLALVANIDLTTADTEELEDALSDDVLAVAIDTTTNLAIVSNIGGKAFVVDLTAQALTKAIDGPESTRDILMDNGIVYILDTVLEAVWVFDINDILEATTGIEDVDDSEFVLATIPVGNDPNGMVIDTTANRLYVANSDDATISVISTLTFQELARVSMDDEDIEGDFLRDCEEPMDVALGTFNAVKFLFVACLNSHDVVVVNTSTLKALEVFPNTVDPNENDDDEDEDDE